MNRIGINSTIIILLFALLAWGAQITIDDVETYTTPQAMMQAIDDNFDELYGKWASLGTTHDTKEELDALYESATSNNIDPDRLNGDSSDDNLIDTSVLASTVVLESDVDDSPVDDATSDPISSNWAYDHVAAADPHTGYVLKSDIGTTVLAPNGDGSSLTGITQALDNVTDPSGNKSFNINGNDLNFILTSGGSVTIGDGVDDYFKVYTDDGTNYIAEISGSNMSFQHGVQTITNGETLSQTDTTTAHTGSVLDVYDVDGTAYTSIIYGVNADDPYAVVGSLTAKNSGEVNVTGPLSGYARYNTLAGGNTLTTDMMNGVVYLTGGGEITIGDANDHYASGKAGFFTTINSDGSDYEFVSSDGSDYFVLKDGTALDAGNELDMGTSNGTIMTIMAIAANIWRVISEDETSTDGGVAD